VTKTATVDPEDILLTF